MCTSWDQVQYHGHPCVVESEWFQPDHHWLMLRPVDLGGGTYIVEEEDIDREDGEDTAA